MDVTICRLLGVNLSHKKKEKLKKRVEQRLRRTFSAGMPFSVLAHILLFF